MGLLIEGKPLTWHEMRRYKAYIKKHGILQFINVWRKYKDRSQDKFFWGDEVEGILTYTPPTTSTTSPSPSSSSSHSPAPSGPAPAPVQLALRGHQVLDDLRAAREQATAADGGKHEWNVTFHPEYGNFMVEATPGLPYGGYTSDLRMVELNMRLRRMLIQAALRDNESFITLTNFPLLGTPGTLHPAPARGHETFGPVCKSSYIPDSVISPHPRFATLSGNVRRRRGKRVNIKHPLFIDTHTNATSDVDPVTGAPLGSAGNVPAVDERPELRAKGDEVHMDAMVFGMGCCCLQVTFQTRSLSEARMLYDQLAVLAPVFLALTANTPFHRGRLVDTDARWDTISAAVDDRTEDELGLPPLADDARAAAGVHPAPPASPRRDKCNPAARGMPSTRSVVNAQMLEQAALVEVSTSMESGKARYRRRREKAAAAAGTATAAAAAAAAAAADGENDQKVSTAPVAPGEEEDDEFHYDDEDEDADDDEGDDDGTDFRGSDPLSPPLAPSQPCCTSDLPPDDHPTVGSCAAPPYGVLPKSRYSSIDCYIACDDPGYSDAYNDVPFKFDAHSYSLLRRAGVDTLLAKHTASLFVRDPLVVFQGKVEVDDSATTEHFESIQSTNWRSVRFKPPPLEGPIGWRVEFRTMEVQITDQENAAFTVFIALLTRAISFFGLNFYVPMSKLDENFTRAHRRDAINKEKFFFRRSVRPCPPPPAPAPPSNGTGAGAGVSIPSLDISATGSPGPASAAGSVSGPCSGSGSVSGSGSGNGAGAAGTGVSGDLAGLASPPGGVTGQWESTNPALVAASIAKIDAFAALHQANVAAEQAAAAQAEAEKPQTAAASAATAAAAAAAGSTDCPEADKSGANGDCPDAPTAMSCVQEMSVAEIICGKAPCFPGLAPLVRFYLDVIKCDAETRAVVHTYLNLIERRARGDLLTGAAWQRKFVASHPLYKQDSVLPPEVAKDVIAAAQSLAEGKSHSKELLGDLTLMPMPAKTADAARTAAAAVRARAAATKAAEDAAAATAAACVCPCPTGSDDVSSAGEEPVYSDILPLDSAAAAAATAPGAGAGAGAVLPGTPQVGVMTPDVSAADSDAAVGGILLRGASFALDLADPEAGATVKQHLKDAIQRSGSPGLPGAAW